MKKTAVEWLVEQVNADCLNSTFIRKELVDEAKAMEKKQMIDAHIEGQRIFDKHDHTQWTTDQAELYFNETYGGKQ